MMRLPIPSMAGVTTARLRFRHVRLEDMDEWMAYMNSAEAIRFMPFRLGDRSDGEAMLQRSIDRYARDGSGLNILEERSTGSIIGQCGLLTQEVDGVPELEIGYHLLPRSWGRGYATEAAVACRVFAQQNRLTGSVISLIDPGNARSQAVAKRNGMVRTLRTLHHGIPADVWRVPLVVDI